MNPHDRNETGTNEEKHNRKEANNKVNTQHITRHDAQPSMMHDKGYIMLLMARDNAYKSNTSKQV